MPDIFGDEVARPEIKTSATSSPLKGIPVSLSLKVSGLVFWGLVFIGLILIVFAIEALEKDLIRHNDGIDNQTFILVREVFEQAPKAKKSNIQRALNKVLESTGAAGFHVLTNAHGEYSVGETEGNLNKKTIYFTIHTLIDSNANYDKATLTIFQIPIKIIIDKQKKQLITFMVLLFFAFGMLLQWVLKKMLSAPIEQMVQAAQSFSSGNEIRFNDKRKDEFGYLARFINKALDTLTQRQHELTHQASHDKLTGLYNRNEFDLRLNQYLFLAQQEKIYSSLCYMDLDQFKIVNDTCGHIAGDELLKQISHTLRSELRDSDFIARLGGDEFAVLLQGCEEQDAIRISTKLLNAVKKFQFVWEGKTFPIGVSIGVATITPDTISAKDVLSLADVACYTAKDKGRNQIHVYQPHDQELKRRKGEMLWVSQIREALKNNSFKLYQQAITPVMSGSPAKNHYEILLRIPNEQGILYSPTSYLGAAELYGLMTDIDNWVIKNTFLWMVKNKNVMENIAQLAINLSGQSLSSKDCLKYVISLFNEYDVNPEKICFEITETSAIANFDSATKFINVLRELGCQFALDDFGSGMSSFAYLKNLNIDYLKIDGSYVKDLVHDPIDRAMVEAVNQIGHAMGISTIAEFVEDQATLGALSIIGVDYAQGYGIAKPAPIDDLIKL